MNQILNWLIQQLKCIFIFFLLINVGCSGSKSGDSVFPNTKPTCLESAVQNRFLVKWSDGRITVERGLDRQQFINEFVEPKLADIDYVEHDQQIKLFPSVQKSSVILSEGGSWGIENTQVPVAWQNGIRGDGVLVAVIDTGADVNHSQLTNRIAYNAGESGPDEFGFDKSSNGIDDDGNGLVDDYAGFDFVTDLGQMVDSDSHGTHVSGIVAAEHNDTNVNHAYAQGVAPGANILPLKFISSNGGALGDAIEAIDYAVARGAKIINASWGGASCSVLLGQKIAETEQQGVLFVAAAGNRSANIDDSPEYPASYNLTNQLTIGSIGTLSGMASHSNFGDLSVHLFAPGFSILSTVPNEFMGPDFGYARYTGTSMATPFVAGAAALLWSHRPGATLNQIKRAIINSVTTDASYRNVTQGRLNIPNAISYIENN